MELVNQTEESLRALANAGSNDDDGDGGSGSGDSVVHSMGTSCAGNLSSAQPLKHSLYLYDWLTADWSPRLVTCERVQ